MKNFERHIDPKEAMGIGCEANRLIRPLTILSSIYGFKKFTPDNNYGDVISETAYQKDIIRIICGWKKYVSSQMVDQYREQLLTVVLYEAAFRGSPHNGKITPLLFIRRVSSETSWCSRYKDDLKWHQLDFF